MIFATVGLGVIALVLAYFVAAYRSKALGLRDLADHQANEQAKALDTKSAEIAQLAESLRSTRATCDTLQSANDDLATQLSDRQAEDAATRAANDTYVQRLLNQIANLEAVVRRAPTSAPQPDALWQLELLRSERTWRHSVAPSPTAEGPFSATDNPLRLAVEIEAAALREEVGAFITVRWDAANVEDPGRCLLLLRVAQELLAEAARDPYPIELVATSGEPDGDGHREVTLSVVAPDEQHRTITLDPPTVDSSVIDISTENGMIVTVR